MGRRRRQSSNSYNYSFPTLRVSQPVIAKRSLEVGQKTRQALQQLEQLRNQFLREIEDRRRFHPSGRYAAARDRRGRISKISVMSILGSQMRFSDPLLASGTIASRSPIAGKKAYPKNVTICVRRKTRREVLFAAGVAGGRVSRRRRRTSHSNVFC